MPEGAAKKLASEGGGLEVPRVEQSLDEREERSPADDHYCNSEICEHPLAQCDRSVPIIHGAIFCIRTAVPPDGGSD